MIYTTKIYFIKWENEIFYFPGATPPITCLINFTKTLRLLKLLSFVF